MVKVWEPRGVHGSQHPSPAKYHYPALGAILCVSAFVAFGPQPEGLSAQGQRAMGLFTLCASLWVTGLIPLQITSILAIVLLPPLGVLPSSEAFALFGNSAVFFILGAFILSAVIVDCGLSVRLSCLVLERFSSSPEALRNAILFLAAFASFWMSEHAVAAMLFPLVTRLVRAMGLQPLRSRFGMGFYFALAWGCVIGGIATYLGGARNPLAVGILFAESGIQIGFLTWLTASFPLVVLMLAFAWLVLRRSYPPEPVDMAAAQRALYAQRANLGPMSPTERMVGGLALLTISAWVFLHHRLGLANIALLSVALMFMFRLTTWEAIERDVNWGIILMYGGAIALGTALDAVGAAEWMVSRTLGRLALSPFHLVLALGCVSLVLTEFISNAAVVSVLMPVGLGMAHTHGIRPEVITLAVALPSGLSFILPMGTPATAIAYSSGFMRQREFIRSGVLMMALSLTAFALVARFYWPLLAL